VQRQHPPGAPHIRIGTFLEGGATRIANLLSTESLVAVGWDGRPVFRLAESGVESPDGLTLTIQLRSNLKFHSGDPVTAERVRQLLVARAPLMNEVSDIRVDGESTLVFRLRRAHAFKLVNLNEYGIQDETVAELRTGPFRVLSLDTTAVLESFDDYHLGPPSVGRVEIQEYPSHRAAWTAMMREEINFLHEVNHDAIDFVEAGGNIHAYPLLRPYYVALVFNVRHEVLQRRAVRLALNDAIDREEIVRTAMRGHGRVAEGPFWPHHWAYSPGEQAPLNNPQAASIRLDTAGLPVQRRPQGMPARFAFTCLLPEGDSRFERIALVAQRQLFAIGVDMRLEPVPQHELEHRIASGQFDAFLLDLVNARMLSLPYRFWHSATTPLSTGYTAADDALDRMRLATNDRDVRAAVSDVMRVMRADPPAIFLAWPREARAADRSIELPYEPDRDVFGTLWQARRAGAAAAASMP
jgi:ABC-type transport system substrate-binding protein